MTTGRMGQARDSITAAVPAAAFRSALPTLTAMAIWISWSAEKAGYSCLKTRHRPPRKPSDIVTVLTTVVITNIVKHMKEAIQLDQSRASSHPEEAAFLDLLRATDMLSRGLIAVLKTEDLSATQYNVLRILRGAPEGLPCGEIANRMITKDPDITRLLDRLEKRGLISRCSRSQGPADGDSPDHAGRPRAPGQSR